MEVVVRYTVKPGRAEENRRLVEHVYAELAERGPAGFRYATFCLADGVSFVHVASVEEGHVNPLSTIAAFADFTRDIAARCEEPPIAQDASIVGSYGLTI